MNSGCKCGQDTYAGHLRVCATGRAAPHTYTGPGGTGVELDEAERRMKLAADAYSRWTTESLRDEFILLSDEAPTEPEAEAKREAIGLALIHRGHSARILEQPWLLGTEYQ